MAKEVSAHRLFLEQQRMLFSGGIEPIFASIGVALLLCGAQYGTIATPVIIGWFGMLLLVCLWRLMVIRAARIHDAPGMKRRSLHRQYLMAVWVCSLVWGSAAFLLFPEHNPAKQAIFTISMTGISAGAISSLCPSWPAVCGFLIGTLIPLALRFWLYYEENGPALCLLVMLYLLVCLHGARRLHRNISENITLRLLSRENERILKVGEERYRHILNHSPIGILNYDRRGKVMECNEVFCRVLSLESDKVVGRSIHEIFAGSTVEPTLKEAMMRGEDTFTGDYKPAEGNEDSRVIPIHLMFKATRTDNQTIKDGICILVDLSERKRLEDRLQHQASYDELTGLPNRRLLMEQLAKEISRSRRHHQVGAVLLLDLDNFKTINDALGHTVGDLLLQELARRLSCNLRKEDMVARLGGDEFVVLLADLGGEHLIAARNAQNVLDKLNRAICAPFNVLEQELNVTPSIGVALFPDSTGEAGDVLKQADTAMNQAKSNGRNTFRFFQPSMQEEAGIRLLLINDLRKAIENNELSLHYQPQVTADGTIVGAEALLRWIHAERGFVSPADFIPAAEESGLILELGNWVLNRACRTIQTWETAGLLKDNHKIAVNISAREFSETNFVKRINSTITTHSIAPRHLDIELTEGSLISSVSDTVAKMEALGNQGIRISVDDFGTGYSSLSYLKQLPLHTLKIDRSFINDIGTKEGEVQLVEIIINMAKSLGLGLVAEGVETDEQLDYLAQHGCDVYQGYYFCRPIPEADFTKLLEQGRVEVKRPAVA